MPTGSKACQRLTCAAGTAGAPRIAHCTQSRITNEVPVQPKKPSSVLPKYQPSVMPTVQALATSTM